MGDIMGFLKVSRKDTEYRPVGDRLSDASEVTPLRGDSQSTEQASRCMDCGTPFCHWGCPIGNIIPEWNDLVFRGKWKQALDMLQARNNLPEVTGRVCPAPCEYSCVLAINDDPVTIRENELSIIEKGFEMGYIKPNPPALRTGKNVAVIGSGPSGIACADQLNKAGHTVTLFEKDVRLGGILRYGIPDFKLDKSILDRRLNILAAEGINIKAGVNVGIDMKVKELLSSFDAIALTGGSREPRDLPIEGRGLRGIYFAMDYLIQYNHRIAGDKIPEKELIDVKGKTVVVIGGGDTGSDCIGVSHRLGAAKVIQLELLPRLPEQRTSTEPWPYYPRLFKTTSSHEEGGNREWQVTTKKFTGDGSVKKLHCARVHWDMQPGKPPKMQDLPDSEFSIDTDIVVLAMGFLSPVHNGLLDALGVGYDQRGNVKTGADYRTSVDKVYSAGDMHRGQSLVVWAVMEGRDCAREIDLALMGQTSLPKSEYK
jgi:glutamate synthase (NADPH/NADH) small chain